jgi:anti-sigma factor RsiW
MNCKQIQSLYFDYADGTPDQEVRMNVDRHLTGCVVCRHHYEIQRNLHQDVTAAVANELADLHFQQMPVSAEPAPSKHRFSLNAWVRQIAYAFPALLLLGIVLWPLIQQSPRVTDDPTQSSFTEAYQYFEMHSADRSGATNLIMPVAVIIQPGAPARVIELDGTTDISAEIK